MSEPHRRKLIEVALPLEAINRESAREKSIRHGHPSTLHLWWARRPLAACRAILFASVVDDPSSQPDLFPTDEEQEAERQRLFRIIEKLIKWENSTNEDVLGEARAEILKATEGKPPPVLDPFCGGGSIPLEAQRLGLEARGSDLNPIAVLITKALVEIPPMFAGDPPINPEASAKLGHGATWVGAKGLADDIRYYANRMRDKAVERIGHLYPDVTLDDGRTATVVAWLWAHTIKCPNPACGVRMPLLTSLVLSKRRGREARLETVSGDPDAVPFKVRMGAGGPVAGSVGRSGATCLACGTAVPLTRVRQQARDGDLRAQLLCTVADGDRRRIYLDADDRQASIADVARPSAIPETDVPYISGIFNTPIYGLDKHWKLFTNRQLVALDTFVDVAVEAREELIRDGATNAYADAVFTYLALTVGRLANRCSRQCYWDPGGEGIMQVFARQALPMVWAYAEANPFSDSSGNFLGQVEFLAEALERTPARGKATVVQLDAASVDGADLLVCTDPPYYNNIPYADLSDFFYVWIRRMLSVVYPNLFSTLLVPKTQELIADSTRHNGDKNAAAQFFEAGLRKVFANLLERQHDQYPLTIFYAFRQAEDVDDGAGRVSTGWETMLQGLLDAGAAITGTWPVRTEQPGGLREVGRAALASSIVLVCRKREVNAPLASRKEFLGALKDEFPDALRTLQRENIAPVDLAQASIGPGIAVFSRYKKVVEADGSSMTVRMALGLINQVLDEILAQQEGDFDADSRWALAWFEECGLEPGPFGKAETLSKAKNTAINGLVQAGIIEQKGNRVRLLDRSELPEAWDPGTDTRLTVWEVTQHLIRALTVGGEGTAAELLRRVGGLGEVARELAYRLFAICERKGWAQEALAYNALVVSWPEIARLSTGQAIGSGQQSMGV